MIKSAVDTELKQRAVFYYRLLKSDIALAEKIVNGDKAQIDEFYEDKNEELKERLFLEFNTLSVVYQKPSEKFLKDSILKHAQSIEKKYYARPNWNIKKRREDTKAITGDGEAAREEVKDDKDTTKDTTMPSLDDLLDLGGTIPSQT